MSNQPYQQFPPQQPQYHNQTPVFMPTSQPLPQNPIPTPGPYDHLPDYQRHLKDDCYGWNCGDFLLGCFFPHFVSCYNQSTLHNSCLWGLYGLFCFDLCSCCFSQQIEHRMGVEESNICWLLLCQIICRPAILGRERRAIAAWVRQGKPVHYGIHNGPNNNNTVLNGVFVIVVEGDYNNHNNVVIGVNSGGYQPPNGYNQQYQYNNRPVQPTMMR